MQYQYQQETRDDREQKTYVRQCERFSKPKQKQHKPKTMRELRNQNVQKAIETRETFKNARQGYDPELTQNKSKRKIPKNLQHVESVIKKRVELDKEINRKNRQNNSTANKEPEIFVPNQKEGKGNESKHQKHKSRSGSKKRRNRADSSPNEDLEEGHPPQGNYPQYQDRNQRPINTEGSSYPSVTQASAPPPEYYNKIQERREERKEPEYRESGVPRQK